MTRLPSIPSRNGAPKRLNPVKTIRTSESCNFCQHSAKSTNSSSQTIDVTDEYFLKDAIIRFPRTYAKGEGQREEESALNEHSTQTEPVQPIDMDVLSSNLIDLTLERPKTTTTVNLDPKTKRLANKLEPQHRIGEVPKYLVQRKKDIAHAQAMSSTDAPTGHYLLTEEERLEALHLAQTRYDYLIQELNAIPITSQTFRTRTKKIELEKELQALENTLKIFSRNKVFVNLEE